MICVDEGHPGICEGQVHDVCGRGSTTLSRVSRGFDSVFSGYAFYVKGLVPGWTLMPSGAGQVILLCRGIYCVGCALGVRA